MSLTTWVDIWLTEGFATYAELLWIEREEGSDAYRDTVAQRYSVMVEADLPPPGAPPATDLFNRSVYQRGALTLHALREEVGDPTFFGTLRLYGERFRYGNASTEDFIAVAEELAGRELHELFASWLGDAEMPELP